MGGCTHKGAVWSLMYVQGESADEVAGLAQAMLELGVQVDTPFDGR